MCSSCLYLTDKGIKFTKDVLFTQKEGEKNIKEPQPNKHFTITEHVGFRGLSSHLCPYVYLLEYTM